MLSLPPRLSPFERFPPLIRFHLNKCPQVCVPAWDMRYRPDITSPLPFNYPLDSR